MLAQAIALRVTIALAVLLALFTCEVAANAQTTPSDTTSAPLIHASPSPAPRHRHIVAKPISLAIVPTLVLNTGGDENPHRSALAPYSVTALGFRFGYDITDRLTAYWNRTTPNALNGRYYNAAHVAVYGNLGDDINDSYGLSYALTKSLSVDAGYTRRWRINFPAAGDPANPNPAVYSGAYLGAAWRFGPNTIVGKPFTLYATATDVDHVLNSAARAALPNKGAGIHTPGWEVVCTSCGLSVRFPVFHQAVFVPRLNYQYSANYADSSVYVPYTNILEWGADIIPAKFVTFTITVRTFNGHELGYPYPTPQNQHYSYVNISANFHARAALPK
jgi:hypothetical protein